MIILFDEDYVAEKDIRRRSSAPDCSTNLPRSSRPAAPDARQLIRSGRNVLVFAQKPPAASTPGTWTRSLLDPDTPLGATKPSQFSCALSRGGSTHPLLMMNNWADVFPPRPTPNLPLVKASFILQRARECVEQRGHIPNLILTDYYNRGQVVQAVAELNGVANVKPASTTPVPSP